MDFITIILRQYDEGEIDVEQLVAKLARSFSGLDTSHSRALRQKIEAQIGEEVAKVDSIEDRRHLVSTLTAMAHAITTRRFR